MEDLEKEELEAGARASVLVRRGDLPTPPPDLMPVGGDNGEYQIKWLDPASDIHAKVEFKYPISFLPCRDFLFHDDPVGGELLTGALCKALGPGEPNQQDLLTFRRAD